MKRLIAVIPVTVMLSGCYLANVPPNVETLTQASGKPAAQVQADYDACNDYAAIWALLRPYKSNQLMNECLTRKGY